MHTNVLRITYTYTYQPNTIRITIQYDTVQKRAQCLIYTYKNHNFLLISERKKKLIFTHIFMQNSSLIFTKCNLVVSSWTWQHTTVWQTFLFLLLFFFKFFSFAARCCKPSIQNSEIVLLGSEPCPCPDTDCIYTDIKRSSEWWRSVRGPTPLQPRRTHIHPTRCIMEMKWTHDATSITTLHHVWRLAEVIFTPSW